MPRRKPSSDQPLPLLLQDYVLDENSYNDIPSPLLAVPGFGEAWSDFVAYRIIKLNNPMSVRAAKMKLTKLVKHLDHADPVEAITKAMDKLWDDVYPESLQSYQEQNGERHKNGVIL
jgi:hypothetical protein